VDTQISRLGGPNFHEIPVNASVAAVHNNQRDGMHRQALHRGRVAYEPNSLGGGCPFQAGARGFTSFPQPIDEDKVRGKPEKFADHYTQAALFYNSQSPIEKAHIVRAFRFELTKVQVAAIRERVVSQLVNVDKDLARQVADGLGIEVPEAQAPVRSRNMKPEVKISPALSLFARPGDGSIRTRCIALLVVDGVHGASLQALHGKLVSEGAVPKYVGIRLGTVRTADGKKLNVDVTLETAPSVVFDAMVVPDGDVGVKALSKAGQALEFVKDQFRHCKTILALGAGTKLLDAAGIPSPRKGEKADAGVLRHTSGGDAAPAFIAAVAKHRHFERQEDPPPV
jgi:catalase